MARGVTEKDVHRAADALVFKGERPTVERIRAHLGTGSPNTVTRLLDTWWQALPARLAVHGRSMTLPDAPQAVADLASDFWQLALSAARVEVDRSVEGEREVLAAGRSQLDSDRVAFASAGAAAAAEITALQAMVTLLEARLCDSERIVSEQSAHLDELRIERRETAEREAQTRRSADALQLTVMETRAEAQHVRTRLEVHIEHVESRAATEIDRARQAQKVAEAALQQLSRTQTTEVRALKAQNDRAVRESTKSALEAARQRARADALALALRGARRASQARPATRARTKTPPRAVPRAPKSS